MIEVTVSPARIPAGAVTDLEIRLTNRGPNAYLNVIFTIRLPVGIMRLRGPDRITIRSLPAGESATSSLRVRTANAGRYRLTSPNFSYRDHTGRAHRETGCTVEITVDPEQVPVPEPEVTAELQTAELPLGEWSTLRGHVSNVGTVDVSELELTLSGQVTTENRGASSTVERLPGWDLSGCVIFRPRPGGRCAGARTFCSRLQRAASTTPPQHHYQNREREQQYDETSRACTRSSVHSYGSFFSAPILEVPGRFGSTKRSARSSRPSSRAGNETIFWSKLSGRYVPATSFRH